MKSNEKTSGSQQAPEAEGPGETPSPEAATETQPEAAEQTGGAETAAPAGQAAASEGETAEAEAPPETPEEKLARELGEAKELAQGNYDKHMRLQAEFENYKKRLAKEQAETLKYTLTPLLRDLLAIQDNLERAMEHARNNPGNGVEAILSGVEMVAKQLGEVFEKYGMTRIEALGQAFDPTLHEAMGVVETLEVPENQVMEEYQAGYKLHERIVRPAMVIVSKRPQGNGESPPEQEKTQG
jgi:molecular chaperone GrpE